MKLQLHFLVIRVLLRHLIKPGHLFKLCIVYDIFYFLLPDINIRISCQISTLIWL